MAEKCSRKILAICITVSLLLFFTMPRHIASAVEPTGVMIPLYTYPDSTWDSVVQQKNAHPSVPVVAIINPDNGPGASQDPNYITGIQKLQSSGVTVIGYVYTSYGLRSASIVAADIDQYKTWYNVKGIFFDEMSSISGHETYYKNLSDYAKSNGLAFTVGNPGLDTLSSYVGTVDNLIIYENAGLPSTTSISGWHTDYDKKSFSLLSYAVSALDRSFFSSVSDYVGYMYITNDNLPNPWDALPLYFADLVASLDIVPPTQGSQTISPVSTQGSLSIQSVSLSGSSISGLWTEISSNGNIVKKGYTPLSYTASYGTEYTVCVSNYKNYLFDHWDTGSTNRCTTVTPTQSTVLTADYIR